MTQDTRPPVGSTGTLADLQVQPGDGVRFMTGHEYEITRVCDGSDVDFEAKRTRVLPRDDQTLIGDQVTIDNAREDWTLISRAARQPTQTVTTNGRHYDLTALETPFGLLPEPVQVALQAWPHGVTGYTGKSFNDRPFPAWHGDSTYRAKPAPVETRVPCQRGLAAFRSDMEFGTCIERNGKIIWDTWEPTE